MAYSPSEDNLIKKVVYIGRVTKVVKGGRNFGFSSLIVIGDGQGRVGYGKGKAKEVPSAVQKAEQQAKNNMVRVNLKEGRTLYHDIMGKYGAGKVFMRSAPAGTGIIAGGASRAVFEALGMSDVVAKSLGSSNPYNVVKATFDGLKRTNNIRNITRRRSMHISNIIERRDIRSAEDASGE